MRVLVINLDKKIFESGSASLKRLKLYAGFCEKMVVIVLTLQRYTPIKDGNLEVYATGSLSRLGYFFDARRFVKRVFKKEKMDLVMTQDPFETGLIGWLTKRKYQIPWQCQIHGDIFSPYFRQESLMNKIRIMLAKFLLPKADGIRVVSGRIKKSLVSRFPRSEHKIIVLPIYVDVNRFVEEDIKTDLKQKYTQFDCLILIASRLSREKNISMVVSVMSDVIKKYPKTGLLIVGDGKEKLRLETLVKNLSLESNVIFEPWVSDLTSYYKTADIFLLTSNYEGWGMTIVEAAACGCPIIMTDVGCADEFIINEKNGLVIDVGDDESFVSALEKLITDKNFARQLGTAAQEAARSLPSQKEYLALYEKSFAMIIPENNVEFYNG